MAYSDKGPSVPSQPRTLRSIALSHITPASLDGGVALDPVHGVPSKLTGGEYEDKALKAKATPGEVKWAHGAKPFGVK